MNLLLYGSIGMTEAIILFVIVSSALVVVVPVWRILVRMGFPGWLALLFLVPLVDLLLIWIVAFADWPALRRTPRN